MYKFAKNGLAASLFSLLLLSSFTPALAVTIGGGTSGGTMVRSSVVKAQPMSYMNTAQKFMVKGTLWSVKTLATKSTTSTWHAPSTPGNGSLIGGGTTGRTGSGTVGATGNPAGKYGSGLAAGSTSFQTTNPAKKYQVVGSTLGTASNPAQKYGTTGSTGAGSTSTWHPPTDAGNPGSLIGGSTGGTTGGSGTTVSGPSWQTRNPAQKFQTGSTTTPPASEGSTTGSGASWQTQNPAQKYQTGGSSGSGTDGSTSGSGSSWQTQNPAQKYDTGSSSSSGSSGSWQASNPAQKFDVPNNNYGPSPTPNPGTHPGLSKCEGRYYPNDIDGHWSEIYVRRLYDLCVLEGYGNGSFRPDQSVTRAELTKMALYAKGIQPNHGCYDADCGSPFNDLAMWQGPWIRPAWDLRIVQGYSYNRFRPNQSITRAESVKVVLATFGYEAYSVDNSFFNDVSGWSTGWIEKAHMMGVVQGIGNGNFDPNRSVTRAEAAKIIVKTLEYWDTHIN